jgi:NAD(P)-dependent dehydrogenase (short-subunit alcohol dehydrogenase family)
MGHRFSDIVWDDINYGNRAYDPWSAYGQSKTANILFAVELDRRGREHGIRAFSLHPGGIITGHGRMAGTVGQHAGHRADAYPPLLTMGVIWLVVSRTPVHRRR